MADTVEQGTDPYQAKIDAALRAARRVGWAAGISFYAGIAVVVFAALRYILGDIELQDAAYIVLALGIAGMASGVAFYATSWNMRIGAARLQKALER